MCVNTTSLEIVNIVHFDRRFESLDKVLSRLSSEACAVFLLLLRDSCAIDEIAGRLSIERSTVAKHLVATVLQWSREIASRGQEPPEDAQIEWESANWLVEAQTDESNLRTRERFNWLWSSTPLYSPPRWLSASRSHKRAYDELYKLWELARGYDSRRTIDVESLIAEARAEASVIPSVEPRGTESEAARIAAKAYRLRANSGRLEWTAAAALAVVIIAGLLLSLSFSRPQDYETGIGERRMVRLPDGSTVELDGASRIRVRYSAHERRVDLLAGQALFSVVKNSERPFDVVSGGTRIRDIGTRFDVNQIGSDNVVAVLEGRVAVTYLCSPVAAPSSTVASSRPIEVGASQQVVVTCNRIPRVHLANLATVTGWTRDEAIYESAPLAEVAVEFNRYNVRQLVIVGTELQNLRIGGIFPLSKPFSLPRLLGLLRAQIGIQVIEAGDRIIITKKSTTRVRLAL